MYHKSDCDELVGQFDLDGYPIGSMIVDMFLNNIDAAKAGYYPCMKCKP